MSDLIALTPDDDDMKRAVNILVAGGFVINEAAQKCLPQMASAIRLYREIDRLHQRDTAVDTTRTEQFTAPWPSR